MYNKFLEKYLEYEPKKALSKKGIRVRQIISPILRFVVPLVTPNSKMKIIRRANCLRNRLYLQHRMVLEKM